jgi:hypothetical protein
MPSPEEASVSAAWARSRSRSDSRVRENRMHGWHNIDISFVGG